MYGYDGLESILNNALHTFLELDCQFNHKLAVVSCDLITIPCSRRTFDRTLKTMSTDIKDRIFTMGYLFVAEHLAMVDDDHSTTAIDSTLIKAKGHVLYGINHP